MLHDPIQEKKQYDAIRAKAKEKGWNPDNPWDFQRAQILVEQEDPKLFESLQQPNTINSNATVKASDCIQSGNMRPLFGAAKCNRDETYFAICGKERPTTETEKYSSRITFAVSDRPIKMPILPAKPGKAVDGRAVTKDLIDGVLNYDVRIRPAVLKLDVTEAHGQHESTQNMPALGRVDRVYDGADGFIWADVSLAAGFEEQIKRLIGPGGLYPDRSIEADYLYFGDSEEKTLWLEAIALCGGQRPALNLPPAQFGKIRLRVSHQDLIGAI